MDKIAHKQSKVLSKCGTFYDAEMARPKGDVNGTKRELLLSVTELRQAQEAAKKAEAHHG
jgi:hypothetical protein